MKLSSVRIQLHLKARVPQVGDVRHGHHVWVAGQWPSGVEPGGVSGSRAAVQQARALGKDSGSCRGPAVSRLPIQARQLAMRTREQALLSPAVPAGPDGRTQARAGGPGWRRRAPGRAVTGAGIRGGKVTMVPGGRVGVGEGLPVEVAMVFTDRADAGRRPASRLEHLRGEPVVVLGLPRGGVPAPWRWPGR